MDIEEKIKKAEEEAKENLIGIIEPDKLGYNYYLYEEMKKILKEQGIDWEPEIKDPPSSDY